MFIKSTFSKVGLAAALIAVGSMATIDLAEAKRGDGARGERNAHKASRHQNDVQAQNYRNYIQNKKRKNNKNARKLVRAIGAVAIAAAASQHNHNRHDVLSYQNTRDWNRRHNNNARYAERKCVAVAKTRRGNGHRIGNIRAKAFGRRACRKAMRRCSNKLWDRRQSFGRNPHAECVVVRRTGGRFSRR